MPVCRSDHRGCSRSEIGVDLHTRHLQTEVDVLLNMFLRVILTRSECIWRGSRQLKLSGKYAGSSKAPPRIHRAIFLVVCTKFCVTMRDKNTAKTALNGMFDDFKRIIQRAFIYQVSRVLWPFKWMATLTGFEPF